VSQLSSQAALQNSHPESIDLLFLLNKLFSHLACATFSSQLEMKKNEKKKRKKDVIRV